jgi:hypothetical protein
MAMGMMASLVNAVHLRQPQGVGALLFIRNDRSWGRAVAPMVNRRDGGLQRDARLCYLGQTPEL